MALRGRKTARSLCSSRRIASVHPFRHRNSAMLYTLSILGPNGEILLGSTKSYFGPVASGPWCGTWVRVGPGQAQVPEQILQIGGDGARKGQHLSVYRVRKL